MIENFPAALPNLAKIIKSVGPGAMRHVLALDLYGPDPYGDVDARSMSMEDHLKSIGIALAILLPLAGLSYFIASKLAVLSLSELYKLANLKSSRCKSNKMQQSLGCEYIRMSV